MCEQLAHELDSSAMYTGPAQARANVLAKDLEQQGKPAATATRMEVEQTHNSEEGDSKADERREAPNHPEQANAEPVGSNQEQDQPTPAAPNQEQDQPAPAAPNQEQEITPATPNQEPTAANTVPATPEELQRQQQKPAENQPPAHVKREAGTPAQGSVRVKEEAPEEEDPFVKLARSQIEVLEYMGYPEKEATEAVEYCLNNNIKLDQAQDVISSLRLMEEKQAEAATTHGAPENDPAGGANEEMEGNQHDESWNSPTWIDGWGNTTWDSWSSWNSWGSWNGGYWSQNPWWWQKPYATSDFSCTASPNEAHFEAAMNRLDTCDLEETQQKKEGQEEKKDDQKDEEKEKEKENEPKQDEGMKKDDEDQEKEGEQEKEETQEAGACLCVSRLLVLSSLSLVVLSLLSLKPWQLDENGQPLPYKQTAKYKRAHARYMRYYRSVHECLDLSAECKKKTATCPWHMNANVAYKMGFSWEIST